MKSRLYSFTPEEIKSAINMSNSKHELLRELGYYHSGNSATLEKVIKEYNLVEDFDALKKRSKENIKNFCSTINNNKLSDNEVFIENSKASSRTLRSHILVNQLIPYICSKCGNNGVWQGEDLGLQVHHINGIHNDNRLENLTFLCPNCHSQTENFMNKDRNTKNKLREKEIKIAKQNLQNQILIEERKKYFDSIDMTKIGWVTKAEKDLGISHTQIRRWLKKHYPEKEKYERKLPN